MERGIKVSVISEYRPENETDHEALTHWIQTTSYVRPVSNTDLVKAFRVLVRRRLLRTAHLCFHVLGRRYHHHKYFGYDREVILYICYLSRMLQKLGVSHVHAPWADLQAFIAAGVATLLDISYSVQARAHDIHRFTYRYGFKEKFERAKFIVTNSRYNRIYLSSYISQSAAQRISIVYEGLPVNRFPAVTHANERYPVRFICIARLIEEKGLIHLLGASDILIRRDVDFQLNIVGGPADGGTSDYQTYLKFRHRELRLDSHVRFLGSLPHEEAMQHLRNADVFVLPCVPSKDGGNDITPNALLEAMATALPVISTTITAIPEIVENEVHGILVPPTDEALLANAMQRLAGSAAMRRKLGNAARLRIHEQFDIAKNIETYTRLFES